MLNRPFPIFPLGRFRGGADIILRFEDLFSEYEYLIKGINFDENVNNQDYIDFLNLLDEKILIKIKELTNVDIFQSYLD